MPYLNADQRATSKARQGKGTISKDAADYVNQIIAGAYGSNWKFGQWGTQTISIYHGHIGFNTGTTYHKLGVREIDRLKAAVQAGCNAHAVAVAPINARITELQAAGNHKGNDSAKEEYRSLFQMKNQVNTEYSWCIGKLV